MAAVIRGLAVGPSRAGRPFGDWKAMRQVSGSPGDMEVLNGRGKVIGRLRLPPEAGPTIGRRQAALSGGLLNLAEDLYEVPAVDPRARRLRLSIELDRRRLSMPVGLALCDLLAHAALEATELELPLAFAGPGGGEGVRLRVHEDSGESAALRIKPLAGGGVVIQAGGGCRPLVQCLRRWMELGFGDRGPGEGACARLRQMLVEIADLLTGCGRWGAWARRLAEAKSRRRPLPPADRRDWAHLERACRALGLPPPVRWSEPALRFSKHWAPETQRVIDAVGRIPAGNGVLDGLVLVSKPAKERRALKAALERILRAKGFRPRVTVLNAYKAGLSWLLEVVQPRLQGLGTIDRLELAFRAFAAGSGALELESRFLQEIYPGPDLVARSLGWPPEKIRLSQRPHLPDAYRMRAWDHQGCLILDEGFTPRWGERPYLPGRPGLGTVHPACGGVRLSRDNQVILDRPIPTDREVFWQIFQERWLPAIEASMKSRLKGMGGTPVFWEDLRIDVAIDENDSRIGLGAERVAPMEALHEDLYFVLLDFFRIFGQENGLTADVQFGRIFPQVHSIARKGVSSARLTAKPMPPRPQAAKRSSSEGVAVHSFGLSAGAIELGLTVPGAPRDSAEAGVLCRIARSWGHDLQPSPEGRVFHLKLRPPRAPGRHRRLQAPAGAPPLNRQIPSSEAGSWARRLGALPNIRSWCAGATWQGRRIWALEALSGGGGSRISQARMRQLKPTLLLNARHHANEVSSTNAALRLMWELGATAWGRGMLQRVNVAAVPLENADGVATLEALLPGCEGHKLHAARYNALGVEWYADYFSASPRFPEARVKPLLWQRWLPLVVLDAHGVPSHEWEQPFSGYAPARFRQFWIPRAFIYAIVPYLDQPKHPGHAVGKVLSAAIARALAADAEIVSLNRELTGRYRRYARRWAPEIFPPVRGDALVVLPPEERLSGLNFGMQRFPVTVSEIVTEVTDEVVTGRLLELCARAHLAAAKALLEWLGRQGRGKLLRLPLPGGGLRLEWKAGKRGRSGPSAGDGSIESSRHPSTALQPRQN
ncbi:MAG: M14 family zinc carboxypeptidase [Hyphomicrobiales bacterium]